MKTGTRVSLLKSLIGIPRGTEGIIDYVSPKLTWVAWDLPGKPLPVGYTKWDARAFTLFRFRRDAFEPDEVTEMLKSIHENTEQNQG